MQFNAASFSMQINHWVDKPGGLVLKFVYLPCMFKSSQDQTGSFSAFHQALHILSTHTSASTSYTFLSEDCVGCETKPWYAKIWTKSFVFVLLQLEAEALSDGYFTHTHVFGDEVSAVQSGSWWKAFVSKIDCYSAAHAKYACWEWWQRTEWLLKDWSDFGMIWHASTLGGKAITLKLAALNLQGKFL